MLLVFGYSLVASELLYFNLGFRKLYFHLVLGLEDLLFRMEIPSPSHKRKTISNLFQRKDFKNLHTFSIQNIREK